MGRRTQGQWSTILGILMLAFSSLWGLPGRADAQQQAVGYLHVCAKSDQAAPVTGSFSFTAGGKPVTVSIEENCSAGIAFPPGEVVVTVAPRPGIHLISVTAVSNTGANVLASTNVASYIATVNVGPDTENWIDWTFTDPLGTPGFLHLCPKSDPAAPVTGSFSFVAGGTPVTVSVEETCSIGIAFPPGNVVVTVTPRPGTVLTNVTAVSDAQTDILVSKNLASYTATVKITKHTKNWIDWTFANEQGGGQDSGYLKICKKSDASAPVSGSYNFTVAGKTVSVAVGKCSDFVVLPAGNVTVTEVAQDGTILTNVTAVSASQANILVNKNLASRTATVKIEKDTENYVDFTNARKATDDPSLWRMIGAGTVFTKDRTQVVHGFVLHCTPRKELTAVEVVWGRGARFHLDQQTFASCTNDPNISPDPPSAPFDMYAGRGKGRYNGVSGATIEWVFTDAGEPGTKDRAYIKIKDKNGKVVLMVDSRPVKGNHQAFKK